MTERRLERRSHDRGTPAAPRGRKRQEEAPQGLAQLPPWPWTSDLGNSGRVGALLLGPSSGMFSQGPDREHRRTQQGKCGGRCPGPCDSREGQGIAPVSTLLALGEGPAHMSPGASAALQEQAVACQV